MRHAPLPPKEQVANSLKSLPEGTHNIITIGFHMVIQHKAPPLIGIALICVGALGRLIHGFEGAAIMRPGRALCRDG
jgi:hypothetical protein